MYSPWYCFIIMKNIFCSTTASVGRDFEQASANFAVSASRSARGTTLLTKLHSYISVAVNGRPTTALLDTGAFTSLLFRPLVEALGLKMDEIGEVAGADGKTKIYTAHIQSLSLMGESTRALDMPVSAAGSPSVGLLIGRDILNRTDIELDLGKAKMRLMRPLHCADEQMAYWADRYSEAKLVENMAGGLRIQVRVNGVYLNAVIGSGAQRSIISDAIAFRANVPLAVGLRQVGTGGAPEDAVDDDVAAVGGMGRGCHPARTCG